MLSGTATRTTIPFGASGPDDKIPKQNNTNVMFGSLMQFPHSFFCALQTTHTRIIIFVTDNNYKICKIIGILEEYLLLGYDAV
jgi:hypothetical protein